MAVDKATKEQDELELYQIDDKAIVPFFQKHLEELKQFIHDHQCNDHLCLLVLLKQFIRTYRMPLTCSAIWKSRERSSSARCTTRFRTASRP